MGVSTTSGIHIHNELCGYCMVIVWLLCGASQKGAAKNER